MKAKYLLFILSIVLLSSCYPRENIVTFFDEETLSKEMTLSTMIDGKMKNSIDSSVDINLLDSDFFERYIGGLIDLEVTSIEVTISGYNNGVTNSKIKLGNTLLTSNIDENNKPININSSYKLDDISRELLHRLSIPFTFSGDCNSADTFKVSVSITFKGIFED